MPRELKIETENHVKDKIVKPWFDTQGAWSYAPIQNGLGQHGIHDRVACLPLIVTQEMVGKKIGLFVSIEAKAPGRRGEKRRGMTQHQDDMRRDVLERGGVSICCDSFEDLYELEGQLSDLLWSKPGG